MLFPGAYKPPDVWKWEQKSGGQFANINRPIAGATHEKKLPVGEHGLQLHSLGTPNGVKVWKHFRYSRAVFVSTFGAKHIKDWLRDK